MREASGMLDKEAIRNIHLIKSIAEQIWGDNVVFGEINILNTPYSQFEVPMKLYREMDVLLVYDRSILDISVRKDNEYLWLSDLTDEKIIEGIDSTKQENLLHNFQVLDRLICKNMN